MRRGLSRAADAPKEASARLRAAKVMGRILGLDDVLGRRGGYVLVCVGGCEGGEVLMVLGCRVKDMQYDGSGGRGKIAWFICCE